MNEEKVKKILKKNIEKFPISFNEIVFRKNETNLEIDFKTIESNLYNTKSFVISNFHKKITSF